LGTRAGLDAVVKKQSPSLGRELNPVRPARGLVTILTKLSRLLVTCKAF